MKKLKQERKTKYKKPDTANDAINSLNDLEHDELSGGTKASSVNTSSTDEDEDEGLGDGNMGRGKNDLFSK